MAKTCGVQLSQFNILHIDFIIGLEQSEALTRKQSIDEIATHLGRSVQPTSREIILPVTNKLYKQLSDNVREGKTKIRIYKNYHGQRWVEGEYIKK